MLGNYLRKVLTIAGSDSGGGAGIQADLKTMSALGVYGSSVVTAITAQNTLGVQGVFGLPPDLVGRQLTSVFTDIGANAVKTGMLYDEEIIEVVAAQLKLHPVRHLVVDPVMVATSGDRLLTGRGERALQQQLLPLADFVTPNVAEAAVLWGHPITGDGDLRQAAAAMHHMGARQVIITGLCRGGRCYDLYFDGEEYLEIDGPKIDTRHDHGTGCTFSAALASFLAYGEQPLRAVSLAKIFVTIGLRYGLPVGTGRGPANHMAAFFPGCWRDEQVVELRSASFNDWRVKPDLCPAPSLYVIVGSKPYQGRDSLGLVTTAVAAGVRLIQLRDKEGETRRLVATGKRMREICHDHGALFIVNDRVDVAAACGADGVHLGQEDLPPGVARALLGPEAIIGVSVTTLHQARLAVAAGADYLGLGPVFPTGSKDCNEAPCGIAQLAEVARQTPIPVIAIGGINPGNTRPLLEAGAAGVAVISAYGGAPDPLLAVREFEAVFAEHQQGSGAL
jgi:hydroxymethylpyrimidine kinase/phosphomethylpyrimidine kinase/thiamine-phosphate diphosphorylase